MSKKSFYCWYLGFTEAYGPHGNARVYEVIQNILKFYYQVDRGRHHNYPECNLHNKNAPPPVVASSRPTSVSNPDITFNDFNNLNIKFNSQITPSKVTICLNDNCLNMIDTSQIISQHNNSRKLSKAATKKPTDSAFLTPEVLSKCSSSIAYDNVTYVCRLANRPYADIVAFIVRSQCGDSSPYEFTTTSVQQPKYHLHAVRCDSEESAVKFEECLASLRKSYIKKLDKEREKYLKKQSQHLHKQHHHQSTSNINDTMMSMNDCNHLHNSKLKNNSFLKRQIFKVFTPSNRPQGINANEVYTVHDEEYLRQLYYNIESNSNSGNEFNHNSSCSHNDILLTSGESSSNINEAAQAVSSSITGSDHVGTIPYYMQLATDHVIKVYPNKSSPSSQNNSASSMGASNDSESVSSSSAASPPPPPPPVNCLKRIELFESLNKEMSEKFRSGQPILYPPRDYEEIESGSGGSSGAARIVRSGGEGTRATEKLLSSASSIAVAREPAVMSKSSKELVTIQNLDSDSSDGNSLREQTDQALKILDDVVNSELNEVPLATKLFTAVIKATKNGAVDIEKKPSPRPVVYQFIPPDKMSSSTASSTKITLQKQMPPQSKQEEKKQNLKLKSTENLDNFRQKQQPEVAQSSRPVSSHANHRNKQLEIIREDLNKNTKKNSTRVAELIENKKNEMLAPLFKKNSTAAYHKPSTKSPCRKSNSSVSNLIAASAVTNSNANCKNSGGFFLTSTNQTIEEQAAAYGIRNGVLTRLGNYHPQWMSTSALGQVGPQTNSQLMSNYPLMPEKNDTSNQYMGKKQLRHCESARTNRDLTIVTTDHQYIHGGHNQEKAHGHVKSLKQTLSFLRRGVVRDSVEERVVIRQQQDPARFVLKPAKSNHDISSFYFRDLAPASQLNRRFFECNNNNRKMTVYKSEPSLLVAVSASAATSHHNPPHPPQPLSAYHMHHHHPQQPRHHVSHHKYNFNDFFY